MLLKFSHEDDLRLCVRIESPYGQTKHLSLNIIINIPQNTIENK